MSSQRKNPLEGSRWASRGVAGLLLALCVGGGSCQRSELAGDSPHTSYVGDASAPTTAAAAQVVSGLRARFTVAPAARPVDSQEDDSSAAPWSALSPGSAKRFDHGALGLHPIFEGLPDEHTARVHLPSRSNAPFRIEDVDSGMLAEITLEGARDVIGEAAEGLLVYPNAHLSGATLLHRATLTGTEDFLSFDEAPAAPEVAYRVRLARGVGGLRLVENTLEFLDDGGAPRLRVAPPFVLGVDGIRHDASLAVEGCAVDVNPAEPWGRAVTAPATETCTVRISWSNEGMTYPALLDPTWSNTGTMKSPRQGHTTTVLSTGKVLAVGGIDAAGNALSSAELFDPATATWATTGSLSGARQLHSTVQLGSTGNSTTSGKVLVIGGKSGSTSLTTAQLYSVSAGTWSAAASMATGRHQASATILSAGKVLLAGGLTNTTPLATALVYDPGGTSNGSWASAGTMATARIGHTATRLSAGALNNKVLVVGGSNGTTSVSSVQTFDGTTSTWTSLANLSTAREGHTATALSTGKVLVAGGKTVTSSGTTILGSAFLFDPTSSSGSWASAGTMKTSRQQHTATLLLPTIAAEGLVLIAGGSSASAALANAETFSGTSTWNNTTSLLTATRGHTADLLSSGLVLIAGGNQGGNAVAASELYDASRGVACSSNSQCVSGFCVGNVCCNSACTNSCSSCSLAGSVGTCTPKPNGTACNDGNACTAGDTCQSAVCSGTPVTCAPPDSCHQAGTCDPASGSCVYPNKPNSTSCSDGNACTQTDTCQNGVCSGANLVACTAQDQCHNAGTCNTSTGVCSNPNKADGTSCNDGKFCTNGETCQGGTCGSGDPGDCTINGYCPGNGASCCPVGYSPVVLTDADDTYQTGTAGLCIVGLGGRDTIGAQGGNSVVIGGPESDIIQAANGDNFVVPGGGADVVATGTGNDTVAIYDLCEVEAGENIDTGTGNDTLITPVPLAELQARGVTVSNVENVVVQSNSCKSDCALPKPDCSGRGRCKEGATPGQMTCDCDPGSSGEHCEIDDGTAVHTDYVLVIPKGKTLDDVALGTMAPRRQAAGSVVIGKGAQVTRPGGLFGGVSALDFASDVTLTGDATKVARVGNIFSGRDIVLGQRVQVKGAALATHNVTQSTGVTVDGGVTQDGDPLGVELLKWSVVHPPLTGAPAVQVASGQTRTLAPDRYDVLTVNSGGTLTLRSGTYEVTSLKLLAGSNLILNNGGGPIFVHARTEVTLDSAVTRANAALDNVVFTSLGTTDVHVGGTGFAGAVLTPNAKIVIGGPGTYKGTFFGRNLDIGADAQIEHHPFARADCSIQPCGTFGCPITDQDGDGLNDCEEATDTSSWSDANIFNGVRSTLSPACPGITSCGDLSNVAALDACLSAVTPVEVKQQSGAWDFSAVTASGFCEPGYGGRPRAKSCYDTKQGYLIHAQGFLALENGGQHCFRADSSDASACGGIFIGQDAAMQFIPLRGGAQCLTLPAGVYSARWFLDRGPSSAPNDLHVLYCFGDRATCTPTAPVAGSLLRTDFDPTTNPCDPNATTCTELCPCTSGGSCKSNQECFPGMICGIQNGRFFGKDPLSNRCWDPLCESSPASLGCGHTSSVCGTCTATPPICTTNADCAATGEVCGQGNGTRFGLGNVNVCWPPICAAGDKSCGSLNAPCGNCACQTTCSQKTCADVDKGDGCGGFCRGLCGDGQAGCTSNVDCQGSSICFNGTCVPTGCTELDPSRAILSNPACPNPPQCISACSAALGRECGPDPTGCRASCGACGDGATCVNGKCIGGDTPPQVAETTEVGAVEGTFSVTDRGEAQYAIPIEVPPGRADLSPGVSLVYVSDKRMGPAGIGWRLTGFSSISRCVSTVAQDGFAGPVRYDATDHYCLDGKRLVPIGNTSDGSPEYRTEIEEFSKIVGEDLGARGPNSFRVFTKSGKILTYGRTSDSSVTHSLNSGAIPSVKRVWGLSDVQDRNGNTMHVTYDARTFDPRSANSTTEIVGDIFEMQPLEIAYGSNEGAQIQADRAVRFVYEDAPTASLHFVDGGEAMIKLRLKEIQTSARGVLARRYKLTYEQRGYDGRLSRLKTIAECAPGAGGVDVCKPPTTFDYDDAPALGPVEHPDGFEQPTLISWKGHVADYDGDGVDSWGIGGPVSGPAVDLNNDGHEAFLSEGAFLNVLYTTTPGPNGQWVNTPHPFQTSGWEAWLASPVDLDGDGIKDILLCSGDRFDPNHPDVLPPQHLGYLKGTADPSKWAPVIDLPVVGACDPHPLLVDVDGDGVANLLRLESPKGKWKALVLPTKSGEQASWRDVAFFPTGGGAYDGRFFQLLDVNGDGLMDVLENHQAVLGAVQPASLWINLGGYQFRGVVGLEPVDTPTNLVFDGDGDGNDEVWQQVARTRWVAGDLTRQREIAPDPLSPFLAVTDELQIDQIPGSPFLADIDGDGDPDLIEVAATPPQPGGFSRFCRVIGKSADTNAIACAPQIRMGHGRRMHLLTHVIDGLGREIDVTYRGNATQDNPNACANRADVLCPRKLPPLVDQHTFSTNDPSRPHLDRKVYRYKYANARAGTGGRGSFGFGRRTIVEYDGDKFDVVHPDDESRAFSITDLTYSNEEFFTAGLLKERVVRSGQASDTVSGVAQAAKRMTIEDRAYQILHVNPTLNPFPALLGTTTHVYDCPVSGECTPKVRKLISTETQVFTPSDDAVDGYDAYGNNTFHERRVFVGSTELVTDTTTARTFEIRPNDWLVGLLDTVRVTDTRSGFAGGTSTRTWKHTYDEGGRLTRRTRAPDEPTFRLVEQFDYDALVHNLVAHTVQPDTSVKRFTLFSYDSSLTFPELVTNTLGQQEHAHFDPRHGGILQSTDVNGILETRLYDAFGRLTEVDGPSGHARITLKKRTDPLPTDPATEAVYRVFTEEVSSVTSAVGGLMIEDVGPLGEIVKRSVTGYEKQPGVDQWVEENFTYDRPGRLVAHARPHLANDGTQGSDQYLYDGLGQLRFEIFADSTKVEHVRASVNTWLGDRAALGEHATGLALVTQRAQTPVYTTASVQSVDPTGLVVTAQDAKHTFSDYFYGEFNQLRVVQSVRGGIQSEIEYDNYGRKLHHFDPDMGVETYAHYTIFDELDTLIDARNIQHAYSYDALGRMSEAQSIPFGTNTPSEITNWDYDGVPGDLRPNELGRLVRVRSGTSEKGFDRHVTRYNYQPDGLGLLESVDRQIAGDAFSTGFEYDDFLRSKIVRYPHGIGQDVAVQRKYDARGNLVTVFDANTPATPYWQVAGTHQGYQISAEQLGNGVLTESTYDDLTGRLMKLKSSVMGPDVAVQDIDFSYTKNGNLLTRTNNVHPKAETFDYDELNRLTDITVTGQAKTHVADYDARGNLTSKVGVGTYDYTFPTNAIAPLHAPHTAGDRTFTYDESGNEIRREGGPEGVRTTTYSSFSLPTRIDDALGVSSFEYDGDQTRVLKVSHQAETGQQTLYVGNLYERVDDTGPVGLVARTHKYKIFAIGKQIAQIDRKETTGGGVQQNLQYLHGDHLGSTQLVTDGAGVVSSSIVLQETTFDPWGKPEGDAAWDNPLTSNIHAGFTGHEHDPERGLINMKGRIYDPELGRFTTPDPFVQAPFFSQSLNRYAYVFNNPLRYTDPSGFAGYQGSDSDKKSASNDYGNPGFVWILSDGQTESVAFNDDHITATHQGAESKQDTSAQKPDAEKDKGAPEHTSSKKHVAVAKGGTNTGTHTTKPVSEGEHPTPATRTDVARAAAEETYRGGAASFQGVSAGSSPQPQSNGPVHLPDPPSLADMAAAEFVHAIIDPFVNTANAVGPGDQAVNSQTTAAFAVGVAAAFSAPGGKAVGALARRLTKTARIAEHLTKSDLSAAAREATGQVVAVKPSGVPFNHIMEVREAQQGLLNRIDAITRSLSNSSISAEERGALESELSEASRLLDYSEKYLPR